MNVSHSAAFGVGLLHGGELVFAYAADGAYPVVGEVGERCSGLDAVVGVAYCGVVDPVAYFTYVFLLVHSYILLFVGFNFHEHYFCIRFGCHAVGNALAHEHELAHAEAVLHVGHGEFHFTFHDIHHYLGRRQVFGQSLPLAESEERHAAIGVFEDVFEVYFVGACRHLLGKNLYFAEFEICIEHFI